MAATRKRPAPAEAAAGERKRVRVTFGSIQDYEALEVVGEGSYGVVVKARHRGTGETVAVKRAKRGPSASAAAAVLREASYLAACRGHPSVVEIRDVVADAATGALFLVTEFVGASLRRVLSGIGTTSPRRFTEGEARAVMRQLLRGAERMHGAGIVHRDIKPENILMGPGGAVKICDLGMAAPVTTPYAELRVGTLRYRAPEQLAGCPRYGPAVDMWALGCVMAELLTGKLMFDAETEEDVRAMALNFHHQLGERGLQAFDELPAFRGMPRMSEPAREVLAGLLAFRPDDRLTAAAALRHPWFGPEAAQRPCRRVARAPRSASASASVVMVTVGDG